MFICLLLSNYTSFDLNCMYASNYLLIEMCSFIHSFIHLSVHSFMHSFFAYRLSFIMGASQSATLVQDNGRTASSGTHQAILRQEMSRRSIHSAHISSRFSSRTMRGHGHAKCLRCSRKWTSHQASANIDLHNLTVKVWQQKCQDCDHKVDMTFKEDEYKRMVNNMLDR